MTTETKFTVGEYKTRDGRRARVYATDGGGEYPIHGAVVSVESGEWVMRSWNANGERTPEGQTSGLDLMPPLREWWVVEWNDGSTTVRDLSPHNDPSFKAAIAKRFFRVREVNDDQA